MTFSIFHFGQSLDKATWSPWQFTHFGSFWQSSKLCPSSPNPAQTALPLHEFLVCPNFLHWKHLWGLGMYGRVSFFRYPILILFGIVCPLMVKTYRLYRMEIRFTAMIPCGWSSFLISSSSILFSSLHLMTQFDELRVLCGETFTGRWPRSLVVFKRFLHCCFVSTSINTLHDFIGFTLSSSAFAIPSIAFFKTNAFEFNGTFWSAASMMRNLGHWLSSWFSHVWFKVLFEAIFLGRVVHHMWGNSGHNPDPLSDYFKNRGLGISPMAYSWLRRSAHTKME